MPKSGPEPKCREDVVESILPDLLDRLSYEDHTIKNILYDQPVHCTAKPIPHLSWGIKLALAHATKRDKITDHLRLL